MSFLHLGGLRRIKKAGAVFAALLVFQVLAVVGASTALAAVTCNYDASDDTVDVRWGTVDDDLEVYVTNGAGTTDEGEIRVYDENAGVTRDCGSATIDNTVLVTVEGSVSGGTNNVEIQNENTAGGIVVSGGQGCCASFSDNIDFFIDLGESGGDTDNFSFMGRDEADTVVLNTGSTYEDWFGTLNGGTLEVNGIDTGNAPGFSFGGFITTFGGDDTYDGCGGTACALGPTAGSVSRVDVDLGAGDDTAIPGLGPEDIDGGGASNLDWVYYNRAGAHHDISVSLNSGASDEDDGAFCVDDTTFLGDATPLVGCEGDDIWDFSVVQTSAGNDYLEGNESGGANEELFLAGEGDDHVDGNAEEDVFSFWDCNGPIHVVSADGAATGCGADTWQEVSHLAGSPNGESTFDPTAGTVTGGDLLDFTTETGPVFADMENGPVTGSSSFQDICTYLNTPVGDDWAPYCPFFENAFGSPAGDTLRGNEVRNVLDGMAGNDNLFGDDGNDVLIGRGGNDIFNGGLGGDAVYFGYAANGVFVDLSEGYATGEGDDTFSTAGPVTTTTVEIIFGSQFNDDITGGLTGFGSGTNFLFVGKAGDDFLTGADSNDRLMGGRGNDVLRGGDGLDTIIGAQGIDAGFGGLGADFCSRSTETQRSC